ncbi:MAG: pantetheine-phosphate adenylyltransferase [Nibricoccus sp.]
MKALYTGSFDPLTRGHIDIIQRACGIFADFAVGVGDNPAKKYMFSREERIRLARETLALVGLKKINVIPVDGLTIDFAKLHGFTHLVKGARNSQDFDYERLLHDVSLTQQLDIETVLLFADPKLNNVSSSTAKELALHQGLIHEFVTLNVKSEIEKKLGQTIIGVTGTSASGKTMLCKHLTNHFTDSHHVNLDALSQQVLEGTTPLALKTQSKVEARFGTRDRKKLGQIVFHNSDALRQLNEINREPLLTLLRLDLAKRRGLIFVEGALLAELNWLHLCNNRVILVKEPEGQAHIKRLLDRGLNHDQIATRRDSQYSFDRKREAINEAIAKEGYGKLIVHASDDLSSNERATIQAVEDNFLR